MATTTTPPPQAPAPKTNRIGLTVMEYKGGKTTLCAGCGHNAISERIIDAMYEMGVRPERVIKMSGIGCSSKSPAYFMNRSHSFNSVHGRMPSVTTGAVLANRNLLALGVSGDGDTASIGVGQFVHIMRRNLPMIYIIEDNGVYGLTKGQFSATADGRHPCRSFILRRQEATSGHAESRYRSQGDGHVGYRLALCHLQRSRRLHEIV